jgi:hypothetical protein
MEMQKFNGNNAQIAFRMEGIHRHPVLYGQT